MRHCKIILFNRLIIVGLAIVLMLPALDTVAQESDVEQPGEAPTNEAFMGKAEITQVELLPERPEVSPEQQRHCSESLDETHLPAPKLPDKAIGLETIEPWASQTELQEADIVQDDPQASGDFMFFRNNDLGAGAPTNYTSVINEPSVGNNMGAVFQSGNWYASVSTDGGSTFSFVNPYTAFPASAGGFCCDQIVIYDPSRDCLFWLLQYSRDGSNNNIQRLAVANSFSDIGNQIWYYYDFTAQDLGLSSGYWLDFPDLVLGDNYLYLTSNYVWQNNSYVSGTSISRIPLDPLSTGAGFSYNYYTASDRYSFRCTHGAGSTMYWAAQNSTSSIRIYRWSEGSGTIYWDNKGVTTWPNNTPTCTGPDGRDWCGRSDSRVLGAWVANGVIGFMWNASQGGSFPYPYIHVARFNESNRNLINEPVMWNSSVALCYPSVSPNDRGHIAGTFFWGGGSSYPNCNAFIWDDYSSPPPGWENYWVVGSTDGPVENKWGDYLASRPHFPNSNTWIATAYSLQGGGANSNARPRYVWFGRERDAPITTSTTSIITTTTTSISDSCEGYCGMSAPSGCFCDEACHTFGDCCQDKCDFCYSGLCDDADGDGIPDDVDNCQTTPNGPNGGTCTPGTDYPGASCTNLVDCISSCTVNGDCSMDQEDADSDGVGDVCDNCPEVPNGPARGTCFNYFTQAVWGECLDHSTCRNNSSQTYRWCDTTQLDLDSDGTGDVCDPTPLP